MPTPEFVGRCIFCGWRGKLTGEHIWPAWSHRYVPPTTKQYFILHATAFQERSDFIPRKRPGDIRDWRVYCVCHGCNQGWMSRLEMRAKPVLLSLMRGDEVRLMPEQQLLVAAWAAMKAIVAEHDPTGSITTHPSQRRRLMKKLLPPENGWAIYIGHFNGRAWKARWVSHPLLVLPEAEGRAGQPAEYHNGQTSTQVIGQLYIHVMRSRMPKLFDRWKFTLPDRCILYRIWPPAPASIVWPNGSLTDRAADYAAGAFMRAAITASQGTLPPVTGELSETFPPPQWRQRGAMWPR